MKQVSKDEIIGKTIKGIFSDYESSLIITFNDDTWIHIYADSGFEHGDQSIEFVPLDDHNCHLAVKAGIITEKQFNLEKRRRVNKEKERKEKLEREEYQRLKEKFEQNG